MSLAPLVPALLPALLLVLAAPAPGALVSLDDPVYGPDSITRDTDTDLEWLDLEFSRGLAYQDVVTLYEEGTGFVGFRHATEAEVFGFFAHAGVTTLGVLPPGDPTSAGHNLIMDLVTARFVDPLNSTARNSRGYSSTPIAGTEWNAIPFVLETFLPVGGYNSGSSAGPLDTEPADSIGHWLVRAVPEPASASLLLLAGGLLGVRRHRRPGSADSPGESGRAGQGSCTPIR